MGTQDLFREDAQLRECEATLLRADERGLLLDRTVFYPQGGGQAGDAGTLTLPGGRELVIADTRKGEGGEILHLPAPDVVAVGGNGDSRQDADDGDGDQQLDQREATDPAGFWRGIWFHGAVDHRKGPGPDL